VDELGRIRGRRIHFAGSANQTVDKSKISYTQDLVKQLTNGILSQGGGLVVSVGAEPTHRDDPTIPLIFDWTVLETVVERLKTSSLNWPKTQGLPVIAVGLPGWKEKIPDRRKPIWERVLSTGFVELEQIPTGLSLGGILREQQERFGDILVAIGGGPGVRHLADLYISHSKHVLPLNVPLKVEKEGASEELYVKAMENPERFLEYIPTEEASAALSKLSLKNGLPRISEFEGKFLNFLSHLTGPKVFYIRSLNNKMPEYDIIEKFFRNVVDPVVRDSGYERFEVSTDVSNEAFLNVEIFRKLHSSSLVIADLTGLRPNCFMEMGYAFGQAKKVIMTVQDGTKLPFDSASIPCHFWSTLLRDEERKKAFEAFMIKNINRKPLVSLSRSYL